MILIILFCVAVFFWYKKVAVPHLDQVCFEKVKSTTVKCVNLSLIDTLSSFDSLDDFICIEKNQNGDIVLITSNSKKINDFSRLMVENLYKKLENDLKNGVSIPWTAFLGLDVFSGYGKEVKFKSINVQNVTCNLVSNFSSGGINQTLHTLKAEIVSDVVIIFPNDKSVKSCVTEVLISEAVIVGKVPEVYLGNKVLE